MSIRRKPRRKKKTKIRQKTKTENQMKINVFPKPKKITEYGGQTYIDLSFIADCEGLERFFGAFSDAADRIWGFAATPLLKKDDEKLYTPLTEAQTGEKNVESKEDIALHAGIAANRDLSLACGGYVLDIDKTCMLRYADSEGLTNALFTLLKIGKRTCNMKIELPRCRIENYPDSTFRALQLDVARKWHPIDYLYKYVDLAAFYGINKFIIHFTDDESYTLPSDAFPKLSTPYRHYTKAELSALDDYAASRSVTIIPEIDMPGHSWKMCLNYPEVFGACGITEASKKTFAALEKLYLEAMEIFPRSNYVHLGGDEAVLGRWLESEESMEYMRKNGIKDISELYGHYVGRMCKFILSKGKTPIVWEGFRKESNGHVPKETVVVAWESLYQLAPDLASDGFKLLNASWKPLYVVSPWRMWSCEEILLWDKYKWDHWLEKSPAYGGDKVFVDRKTACVDGGILCAWGDYLKGYESCRLACQLEFKSVAPRLAALSERLWSNDRAADPDEFKAAYETFKDLINLFWSENSFRGEL